MKNIDFKDFKNFKVTLVKSAELSDNFKIVCKGDEEEEEKLACEFGTLKQGDDGTKVVEGKVNKDFISFLKSLKNENDNKLIPFYELILDDKICFSDYAHNNCIK